MSIVPLSEATVRSLGSSLVITSPVFLLKELVDNAIDAGATSIDVLVSLNTIDKIEVRDNGHGISPADFGHLGCPGHTSKLRSLNELDALGGRTLGFRGVALASANTLADVSLTTRVPTEHVAAVISLAKGGGVDTLRYVGAPVGTAVCVTNLFSHLPVRSQVTAKDAPKNLTRMKELLQSYVLTRPTIKLRFTVLKTPNLSWSYAPAPNSDIKTAAIQLFGTELASQCVVKTFPNMITQGDDGSSGNQDVPDCPPEQETRVIFEALLPKPTADPQKISKGAFISVDARPLSAARGTSKKLLSIFKKRIGDHFASIRSEATLKNPFIGLNVRCPPGSYDVNVEPSKGDVIFRKEHNIIDQFELFLSWAYPSLKVGQSHPLPITTTEMDVEAPSKKTTDILSSSLSLQVWIFLDTYSLSLLTPQGHGSVVES
jgi:DNA mismatch repair protein MutL